MERSVKIALIGFLVAVVFSVMFFFESGSIIIPHPLFSFLLLAVVVSTIYKHKSLVQSMVPLLILAVLRCLNNPLSYTFFMTESGYDTLSQGMYFDVISILEFITVIGVLWFTVGWTCLQQKILFIGLSVLFIGLHAYSNTLLPSFFMGVFVLCLYVLKIEHPSKPALILMAVFDVLTSYDIFLR
jgi:hypothetical protein